MFDNKYYSIIFTILLKTTVFKEKSWLFRKIWDYIFFKATKNYDGPVTTILHGYTAVMNNGYSYPIYARRFNNYNNPLIQLVYTVNKYLDRKIVLVDVGSAIGDTNLLLIRNLPDAIHKFYCVEGNSEFFNYLKENMKVFHNSELYNNLLSDEDDKLIGNLKKTHLGTSSSIGENRKPSIKLDTLLLQNDLETIDVIKIDVDGFDGKVLKGGANIISKFKPVIIFEWHPIMLRETKNDYKEPFQLLINEGFDKFLWFNKYGEFSHISSFNYSFSIDFLNDLCLRNKHDWDFHYDIIAVHKDSKINVLELAEMQFAKNIESRF